MCATLAIIGTGPTGIYTFRELILCTTAQTIWLFERGPQAGVGMPYSPQMTTKHMLANIASIEIPPVSATYLEWLLTQSDDKLQSYGLRREELHERTFTPRLLLGEYYRAQFLHLVLLARQRGHSVYIREQCHVRDIQTRAHGRFALLVHEQIADLPTFDHVFLATGHDFRGHPAKALNYYPNPWSGLMEAKLPAARVGIMGTSLSSIDAAMAVAYQHGRFEPDEAGALHYIPEAPGLAITMMSRSGILPEADFYCPIPYEPLALMTPSALSELMRGPQPLEAFYALFKRELTLADPAYADAIGLESLALEDFPTAYFAPRKQSCPFAWARLNLVEVETNKATQHTVAWRYAILRMHEKVHDIFSHFREDEKARFDRTLKKVFVDNYGAIPSESIRRLLALHEAGVLTLVALGSEYSLTRAQGLTLIQTPQQLLTFEAFIDARGQKAFKTIHLPFPSLRQALLDAHHELPVVDEHYSLVDTGPYSGKVSFGSLPYLMHNRPFIQGITAAAEIGKAMAASVSRELNPHRRRRQSAWLFPAIHPPTSFDGGFSPERA